MARENSVRGITGYEWELVIDESKVRLVERELTSARLAESDSGRAAIGAAGAEEFRFGPRVGRASGRGR